MKIAVIGAPGSGKTFLSKKIAQHLNISHVECDEIYWKGMDLREAVEDKTQSDNWIVEGHMSKISDIVFPRADKILVVDGSDVLSLLRAMKRDWRNPRKAWYNIQFYDRLSRIRNELISKALTERAKDVHFLTNFPYLGEDKLFRLCENFKSSSN